MKRIRDLIGRWGYCKKCGHKAFESKQGNLVNYLCGARCGYINIFELKWNPKNIKRLR